MNNLDHRILIPKSPHTIWELVSDLSKNQTWQVNYTNISFLTTRHEGTGVRWRYSTNDGHEYVAETTAWYDGLGYEYTLVDGVSFKANKGRIRLQEIAEGTIVQWTFSYDTGGFLGGVRNALSFKRQLEGVMVDSLKTLWRVLNKSVDDSGREAKSILRAGLDYEARAQYKPRHPSVKAEPDTTSPASVSPIVEPPISDEDTRPRAPVKVELLDDGSQPEATTPEPAFLVGLPSAIDSVPGSDAVEIVGDEGNAQSTAAATSEHLAVVLETPSSIASEIQLTEQGEGTSDFVNPPGVLPEQPVIVAIAANPDVSKSTPGETVSVTDDAFASNAENEGKEVLPASAPVAEAESVNSGEASIFEIFGVPKPSETQEMRAVSVPSPASPATARSVAVVAIPVSAKDRKGLRISLRRKRVRVRRPR